MPIRLAVSVAAAVFVVHDVVDLQPAGLGAPRHPTLAVAGQHEAAGAFRHRRLGASDTDGQGAVGEHRDDRAVAQPSRSRSQSGTARPSAQRAGTGSAGSMNQLARNRSRRSSTAAPSRERWAISTNASAHVTLVWPALEQGVTCFGQRRVDDPTMVGVQLATQVVAAVVVEPAGPPTRSGRGRGSSVPAGPVRAPRTIVRSWARWPTVTVWANVLVQVGRRLGRHRRLIDRHRPGGERRHDRRMRVPRLGQADNLAGVTR